MVTLTPTDSSNAATLRLGIEAAIADAYEWHIRRDAQGAIRYTPVPSPSNENIPEWQLTLPATGYSAADLALVDVRLPRMLDFEFESYPFGDLDFGGVCVRYSLQLWRHGLLELPAAAVHEPRYADNAVYIGLSDKSASLHLYTDDEGEQQLSLMYQACYPETIGSELTYIDMCLTRHCDLNINWMDEHYPAWRKLLACTESLGMNGAELARHVFLGAEQANHTPHVSLPDAHLE